MAEKICLLVCEGETDIYVVEALAAHFSSTDTSLQMLALAPQHDATSGTYPALGFGGVLNWCAANREKIALLLDFRGASALLVQMDTDIAQQAHPECVRQGHSARQCCHAKLNEKLVVVAEPPRCPYILPTQNTETWLLAGHHYSVLDKQLKAVADYETIADTEQHLIALGFKSKRGANKQAPRKLDKKPARKYKKYATQLCDNLPVARQRCAELDRLCTVLETIADDAV